MRNAIEYAENKQFGMAGSEETEVVYTEECFQL